MNAADADCGWSSLETAKVIISILLPLVLLILGLWIKQFSDRMDRKNRHGQIGVEWRVSVFKDLAPKLNDLYCYFNYVGNWLSKSPDDVVTAKQECDRIVHTNRFLWSSDFMESYTNFVHAAFKECQGRGQELLIRANRDRHRENPNWKEDWVTRFVNPEERISRRDFTRAYEEVLGRAVRDLEIFQD